MLGGIVRKEGLSDKHINQTTQAAHQDDLAGLAILAYFPTSQLGDQLGRERFVLSLLAKRITLCAPFLP
jgi:hypothetical protein